MKLFNRTAVAATGVVACAALVAAGCGGSSGGSSDAATDAAALDLVPKDALGYVVVDTDLDGEGWTQFDKLAKAFYADFEGVGEEVVKADSDDDVDYEKDVEPWLGESAGVAIIDVGASDSADEDSDGGDSSSSEPTMMGWIELTDRSAFEKFLESQDFKKDGTSGDFDLWVNEDDDTYMGVSDDYVVFTDSKEQIEARTTFDGDGILDAEGVTDVVDDAGDGALATLVVSGEGVRSLVEEDESLKAFGSAADIESFDGLAVSFSAEDDGLRLHGFASGSLTGDLEMGEPSLVNDLPGSTLLAIGGNNLGGTLEDAVDGAGKDNPQVQQTIGQLSGVIGVDLAELAEAFGGQFAIALGAEDSALGAVAGSAVGAAMGGGLQSLDPAALTDSASVTLAFSEEGTTSETLEKLVGVVGGLTGATAAPTEATAGDFTTKTATVNGLPVTTAASDEVAAISVGSDVFTTWGDGTLADNEAFSSAWKAADAPDETAGTLWVDFGRVSKLMDMPTSDEVTAGGWVGWAEADEDSASFDVFMHVTEASS